MSSLVSCDSYSLDNILSYVSGGSILRLVLCGSPALSAKLFSCCRKLCLMWDGSGRSRWPSLIRHFGQLIEFRYENEDDVRWLPCGDVKMEDLARTLKSLAFFFFDPISSLFSGSLLPDCSLSYTSLDYATHFPHLHTLKLRSKVALEPSAFALFPTSLTHLDLKFENRFHGISLLSHLPRELKHLSIANLYACEDETLWKHFPPNLESLDIALEDQTPRWVKHLPPSLTWLTAWVSGGEVEAYVQTWPLLPRQLKHVFFYGTLEPFDLDRFRQLPPLLETLVWSVDMSPPEVNGYNGSVSFDQALERYDALVDAIFSCAHASLTTLGFEGLEFCAKTLQSCRRSCKEVELRNASEISLESLPALSMGVFSCLRELVINKGTLEAEVAAILPTTIESLTVPAISSRIAVSLGRRLVSLRSLYCDFGTLSSSGVAGLPQSITLMKLGYSVLESLECVKELPKRLKTLTFAHQPPSRGTRTAFRTAVMEDPASSRFLPESLIKLSIYVPNQLSEDWFKGLALHPSLEILYVSHTVILSAEVLSYMPKRMRQIDMRVKSMDAKSLKNLPTSVRHLCISGAYEPLLNSNDLAILPENAYLINVPLKGIRDGSQPGYSLSNNHTLYKFQLNWFQPTWFKHDFDQFPYALRQGGR